MIGNSLTEGHARSSGIEPNLNLNFQITKNAIFVPLKFGVLVQIFTGYISAMNPKKSEGYHT